MPLAAPPRNLSGLRPLARRADAFERTARAAPRDFTPVLAEGGSTWPAAVTIALLALGAVLCGAVAALAGLNALYLCAALIGCAFILRDFRIGVVLLILLIPVSRSTVFPHAMLGITGLNPLNLLLVAALASFLLHAFASGRLGRFLPQPLLWLYLTPIVIGAAMGVQHVGDIVPGFFRFNIVDFRNGTGYLLEMLFKPLALVVFALLVGGAVARAEKPERYLVPMLVSIWIISLVVVGFVLTSGIGLSQLASSESREFLSKLGLHANELGHLYATIFALLLFTWGETDDRRLKIALLLTMGLVFVALMLTFSRSAFSGFVVTGVLYLLWRRNFRTLAAALVVAIAAFFALPNAVYERITSGFGMGLNAISAGRIDGLWLPMLPELLKSPVYGSGLASILWSEPMRAGGGSTVLVVTHPHNAYLEAALDMGFVGLILLCAYFAWVLRGFRRLAADAATSPTLRGFYTGAAAGLIGLLISDVVDSSLAPRPEQAFLWFAIGMMIGQRAKLEAALGDQAAATSGGAGREVSGRAGAFSGRAGTVSGGAGVVSGRAGRQ